MDADPRYTIAIGDVHGMADEFAFLLSYLEARFPPVDTRFILLGDLIDRGPDTPRTVSLAVDLLDRYPGSQLILGNHDAYFLAMLDGSISEFDVNQWVQQGGIDTMHSYLAEKPSNLENIRSQILQIAPRHYELFRRALPMVTTRRHCFVHAGIDPQVPLALQDEKTVRWIRRGFLDHTDPMEKIIIHGHSITSSFLPEIHPNRVAMDTGSYKSGRISAVILEDDNVSGFVCARSAQAEVLLFDGEMGPVR